VNGRGKQWNNLRRAWLCAALALMGGDAAMALPPVSKLRGSPDAAFNEDPFGESLAANEEVIAVGEPGNRMRGIDTSAAHVFPP
jgi:hypothetical protein